MRTTILLSTALLTLPLLFGCGDDDPVIAVGGAGGTGGGGEGGVGNLGGGGAGNEGGGGTGNEGGGGMGGQTGGDTCDDPIALALNLGDDFALNGTTVGATDTFKGDTRINCGDVDMESGAPDRVYEVTLSEAGSLRFSVTAVVGSELDPALYNYAECTDQSPSLCFDASTTNEGLAAHFEPGTYTFIVDGANGTSGEYVINGSFQESACGDGIVGPGEECDPGTPTLGDGCYDPGDLQECLSEPGSALVDQCPGEQVSIPQGSSILQGTTNGFTNDYLGTCSLENGGLDRVYEFVPQVSGTLTACVGEDDMGVPYCDNIVDPLCLDWMIYARDTCGDIGTELDCQDQDFDTVECVTFPVTQGESYFVFVDGYDGTAFSYGPYFLHVDLIP